MLPERARVGLVEDDPVMGGSIVQRLELEGWRVTWWETGRQAISEIGTLPQSLDLVICDVRLPDVSGETVFNELAKLPNTPPFMFVTGYGEIDQAVRLMKSGAVDFMTKPFSMDEFLRRIELGRRPTGTPAPDYVLGVSDSMHSVEDMLRRFAPHDLPVLITGETGSGKEVAARYLHQISPRSEHPFIAVNCAAIPHELLESELFGHEKGSFTNASQRHLGYAERAGRGTLFLDEIGDMPLALQAKLLRLIEEGSFLPEIFGKIFIFAWRSCPSTFPHSGNAPTILRGSWTAFSRMRAPEPTTVFAASVLSQKRLRFPTTGKAMFANCETASSARPRCRPVSGSCPATSSRSSSEGRRLKIFFPCRSCAMLRKNARSSELWNKPGARSLRPQDCLLSPEPRCGRR
jgi:CheY-like chemotaxis protein